MLINSDGNSLSGKKLSAKASKINTISFNGTIDNKPLKFQATISSENKLVLVASNDLESTQLLYLYGKRWQGKRILIYCEQKVNKSPPSIKS
jgi:hypothetical protein